MKKSFLVFILAITINISFGLSLHSSNNLLNTSKWGEVFERPSPWSYGGTFGLNFIDNGFLFNAGGSVIYRAGNRVFIGISPSFSFVHQKVEFQNNATTDKDYFDFNSTYYDNSMFFRWFALGLKFIQIEPGVVNYKDLEDYYFDLNTQKMVLVATRKTVPYIQAGVGFVIPFGDQKFFIMRCMYDVLQRKDSPYYGLPIIRGGVNIGI